MKNLLDEYVRKPKASILKLMKTGVFNTIAMKQGQQEMMTFSDNLICENLPNRENISVHFLTGKKYWYETAFCAYSLSKVSGRNIQLNLTDDGSIDNELKSKILNQFPNSKIKLKNDLDAKVNELLPESKYPNLRRRRTTLILMKKLIDIHLGTEGFKLFLDSDMLFLKSPSAMLNWYDNPVGGFYTNDCLTAYGFPQKLMSELAGYTIHERVNSGLTGIKSESIDWDKLEYWIEKLEKSTGKTSYFLEQGLTAMILSGTDCTIGAESEYIVKPNKDQVLKNIGTLHHYVDSSKELYYRWAWKKVNGI